MNVKQSYTEYNVIVPTQNFIITFEDYNSNNRDTINVTVDGVPATTAGFTVLRISDTVIQLTPDVETGSVVRLQRETDIDNTFYRFTAGAVFTAGNIDANFQQVLHSQQEVQDGFNKLAGDVYPLVDGLEQSLQTASEAAAAASAASDAASEAAAAAEEAAQVTRSTTQVHHTNGETQAVINDYIGTAWYARVGGYQPNDRARLTTGEIVVSTIANNTNNPNTDMTGWVNPEAEQKDINNQRPTVLQLAKVIGDGVADDTLELQKVFRDADDNRKSYVFIPFHNNNYLINAPLVLQEPAMICGDKGATYNGGVGKDGWIVIGSAAEYAFNLGNERVYSPTTQNTATKQTRNYADNWELKNIGFKPADGVAARTKTGIKHTTRTNGPDRGMTIREISAYSLKYAVHITNQNLSTQLATLVIENSCLSQCDIPVFAEGNVLGLRFVGNQCEQNYSGAIHGAFNAGVTIEDNMLEGQTNAINIYPTQFGNRPKISIKRNYFERNSGQYVMKVSSTSGDCELDVGGNYYFSPMADDYILIDNGVWLVKNTDPHPITLNTATVRAGSEMFGAGVNYYKQREIRSAGHGGFVYIKNFLNLNTPTTETSAVFSTSYPSIETPFGLLRYAEANSHYLTVNAPVTEGDLFSISMLVSCDEDFGDAQIQVYNPDYSAVIGQGSGGFYFSQSAKAGMVLLTVTFKALVTAVSLRVRIQSGIKATGGRKIFGVSARNYGAYVAGGSKNIYPAMPKLNPVVGRVAAQADSVATDVAGLKSDLNALLTKLRNSGVMLP